MDLGPCAFYASFGYQWTKRPYWSPIVTTQMMSVHRWTPILTKVEAAACICSWSALGILTDSNRSALQFCFFSLWTAKYQCKLANHCLLKAFPGLHRTLAHFQLQKAPSWYQSRRFNLRLCNNVESFTSVLLLLLILQHFFRCISKIYTRAGVLGVIVTGPRQPICSE